MLTLHFWLELKKQHTNLGMRLKVDLGLHSKKNFQSIVEFCMKRGQIQNEQYLEADMQNLVNEIIEAHRKLIK